MGDNPLYRRYTVPPDVKRPASALAAEYAEGIKRDQYLRITKNQTDTRAAFVRKHRANKEGARIPERLF